MSPQTRKIALITGDSPHASNKSLSWKCLIAPQSLQETRCSPTEGQISRRAPCNLETTKTPFTADRTVEPVSAVLMGARFLQCGEGCHHKLYALPAVRVERRGTEPRVHAATVDLENGASVMAAFRDRLPLGRSATPDEVAGVIAFLASEDALFIYGVNLPVDGGLRASNGQTELPLILRTRYRGGFSVISRHKACDASMNYFAVIAAIRDA